MSNSDIVRQSYSSSKYSYYRGSDMSKDMRKAIDSIRVDDNFWNVTWDNLTFSIKPFLCSNLTFSHMENMFEVLCSLVISSEENFFDSFLDLTRTEYNKLFTDDENNLSSTILYQFGSKVFSVAKYLIGVCDNKVLKSLVGFIIRDFLFISKREKSEIYLEFKDKDVCNTQAFSYFITIYWALQKSKTLQLILSKEIKAINLQDILLDMCPRDSIHYKYLSGCISSKELSNLYLKGDNPVIRRELFNLTVRKDLKYDSDLFDEILVDLQNNIFVWTEFDNFVYTMSSTYITFGIYEKNNNYVSDLCKELDNLKSSATELSKENKSLKSSLKGVTKERNKLSTKVNSLMNKSQDNSLYEDKLNESDNIISELKSRISFLEEELKVKDNEILHQKQTIRSQIKELKSLNARLNEANNEEEDFTSTEVEDEVKLSIDDMVESLKDFKIGIFGGFDAGSMVTKFEGYGLSVRHIVDEKRFTVGDLDFAVILTSNMQHHVLNHLKSQYNGRFVYMNGTNIEYIIQKMFEVLCKEGLVDGD